MSHYPQFSVVHILQGSVATYVRFGEFVANLPLSLTVKKF